VITGFSRYQTIIEGMAEPTVAHQGLDRATDCIAKSAKPTVNSLRAIEGLSSVRRSGRLSGRRIDKEETSRWQTPPTEPKPSWKSGECS
jgi:hypothetical protein